MDFQRFLREGGGLVAVFQNVIFLIFLLLFIFFEILKYPFPMESRIVSWSICHFQKTWLILTAKDQLR